MNPPVHAHQRRQRSFALRWVATMIAAVVLVAALPACRIGGPRNFNNDNDKLRAERLELQRRIETLEQDLESRLGEIATLRAQLDADRPSDFQGVNTPTLSQIKFGRYSGAIDSDGDGTDDMVRLYIEPRDQRNRLLPVAGKATVQLVDIPADGPAKTIAQKRYDPKELESTWRSTFLGSHFTLELELPSPLPTIDGQITAKVILIEATTAAQFETQMPLRIASK